MKTPSKSIVVVPCHTLEDFPTHFRGNDAKNLLACWTSVWHPSLISCTKQAPSWVSSHDPRIDVENAIVVVPITASNAIVPEFKKTLEQKNCVLIDGDLDRNQIIVRMFEVHQRLSLATPVDDEFVQDFFALGYAFLQVQIMTRQLRYSSNLDEVKFGERLVAAASAAVKGEVETAKQGLVDCFDMLLEEKNCYYPVQPELIDLVLTAETTLGNSLRNQLGAEHVTNLLITGRNAKTLRDKDRALTEKITDQLQHGHLGLVGGLEDELPDPLVATESVVRQFSEGLKSFDEVFQSRPAVFARRKAGLTPKLPGLLEQFDFVGAIHATLDEGRFPKGSSSNIRWTGDDQQSILAFGDFPLSAGEDGALLGLGLKIGEQIDSAHVATLVFAHWPNRVCDTYRDLVRVCQYGPLLGEFVKLNDYFDSVYDPGYGDTFTAGEYKVPFLKQSVEAGEEGPISRYVDYWHGHGQLQSCRAWLAQLATLAAIQGSASGETLSEIEAIHGFGQRLVELEKRLDQIPLHWSCTIAEQLNRDIDEFKQALTAPAIVGKTIPSAGASTKRVFNTTTSKMRRVTPLPEKTKTVHQSNGPLLFADTGKTQTDAVLEIPPMGSVRIDVPEPAAKDPFRSVPPVVEGNLLRNEFFQAQVDEVSGGLRSVMLYDSKSNLISQRLSLRVPGSLEPVTRRSPNKRQPSRYAKMVADEMTPFADSRICGRIRVRGRLVDQGQDVATFEQIFRIARGIPRITIDVEIEPNIKLTSSINHYFCNRLAWKNESSDVHANALDTRQYVMTDWFEATNFIEIQQDHNRLTLLTGGLPFHRRTSRRMLDTVLVVGNESQRRFKMALEVNQRYPTMAARQWQSWMPSVTSGPSDGPKSGWLFHLNCRNVIATWWEPVWSDCGDDSICGVSVRLQETEGRPANLKIHCPCEVSSANRTNLSGEFLRAIDLPDDKRDIVPIEIQANEYLQATVYWKK
jgi:alpha-mannosidase